MMFPPQPPMSFGAPQAFPQGQFSPQVNPLLQQNQQQGFMQQPQRPQFQKNIGGVVVFFKSNRSPAFCASCMYTEG